MTLLDPNFQSDTVRSYSGQIHSSANLMFFQKVLFEFMHETSENLYQILYYIIINAMHLHALKG